MLHKMIFRKRNNFLKNVPPAPQNDQQWSCEKINMIRINRDFGSQYYVINLKFGEIEKILKFYTKS